MEFGSSAGKLPGLLRSRCKAIIKVMDQVR
jgi:hypothetical protein